MSELGPLADTAVLAALDAVARADAELAVAAHADELAALARCERSHTEEIP